MSKLLVAIAVLGTAGSASAENPKFEYGKADDVAEVKGVEWNDQQLEHVLANAGGELGQDQELVRIN